ncbi:flavin reductase family protein [Neptunicoccus cionae]|uniref:Flavin reductase like domain-containing protein n=1 Tax=Neptunicoccus cionae TaxID=2035344 RepID=A0A916QYV0_9RHOB|nr:flavin reductase family protein [Amylibacter cionae]GGA21944.1 hypothetical protein GCM10011498_23330 [Amylibacter cionae]
MQTIDPKELRVAFSSYPTGVTVVTARRADGTPVGFTANSFSSVSLDPPLLLVCPGKFLSSYSAFAECTRFAVNVLAQGQDDIADVFARSKGDRFAQVAHRIDAHGLPLINNAAAQFSCQTHRSIPMGDHSILIGQVLEFTQNDPLGLGYGGGRYLNLAPQLAAE